MASKNIIKNENIVIKKLRWVVKNNYTKWNGINISKLVGVQGVQNVRE